MSCACVCACVRWEWSAIHYICAIYMSCDLARAVQGELTVNAGQEADGSLMILDTVVMATGGSQAMSVPREAM